MNWDYDIIVLGAGSPGGRYSAAQIVVASGSDPVFPPLPGLEGLEGIRTSREATGMKAVPKRPLLLPREPESLGTVLADRLRKDDIELVLGVAAVAARREGTSHRAIARPVVPRLA